MKALVILPLVLILEDRACNSRPAEAEALPTWDSLSFSSGDHYLVTGWYYEIEDSNGVQFDWRGEQVFVDPEPILTAGNIVEVELVETTSRPAYDLLSIQLDDIGAARWANATGQAIGGRLAGIVRGRLVSLPIVNAQIDGGRTSFSLGEQGKHGNHGMLQTVQADSRTVDPVR